MNPEQAKNQIDNLCRLSKNYRIHTSITYRINQRGEISAELNVKNEAFEMMAQKELIENVIKSIRG